MDQVKQKETEQLLDIGVCRNHNRLYQCYCNICHCLICPTCLMFDQHRGHQVSKIQQASKNLRQKISQASKQGHLKFQKTQNVLLDIRHAKLTVEQNKQKIVEQAQYTFDQLIKTLKNRKNDFLKDLNEYYNKQLQVINKNEQKWIRRQEISQHILQLQKSKDDLKLIEDAQLIVKNLQQWKKPLEYNTVKILDGLKTNAQFGKNSITLRDFLQVSKTYLKKGDFINNQYKA